MNLVTFPSVSRKNQEPNSDKIFKSSKRQGVNSPVPSSQLRGVNLKVSEEVPRSSNIRSSQSEISRPTTFIPSETTSTRSVDKRTKLPSRGKDDEELDHTNERRANGSKQKKKKDGQFKRPKKEKQQSKSLPPVAPGCVQVCGSLIYEVYVLLGGRVCDCPRGD